MSKFIKRGLLIIPLALITLVLFIAFHHSRSTINKQKSSEKSQTDINIGLSAFTTAKVVYPNLNIADYSAKLDHIADEVRQLANGTADPDKRIRCLNTVIFLQEKFYADRNSAVKRRPESYFLNNLLDTKQGNCFSMPLLYVALGQRLGWPIYMVHVPDHAFVRYVDPAFKEQNIETTSGGGYVSDEEYSRDFMVSDVGRKRGTYLRTLSYQEVLADLLTVNAITIGRQGNLEQAIHDLELATQLSPTLVDAWANLATANKLLAKKATAAQAVQYTEKAKLYKNKLTELGFVNPRDIPVINPHRA